MKLKLFLENFEPSIGCVSYSVENENGDRVAKASCTHERLMTFNPSSMDLFVLGFLPQLREMKATLVVGGPVSQALLDILDEEIIADHIVVSNEKYTTKAIALFESVFKNTHNLDKTLTEVFDYYK